MVTKLINSASDDYVHTLLSPDTNVRYVIPRYQREYTWNKAQWEDLIRDLQEEDPGQSHFLGTIICLNSTVNAVEESRLELIDGQQRMTTLSILMATLYKMLNQPGMELDEDEQAPKKNDLRRRLVNKKKPRIELQVQGNNDDDYRWLLRECGLSMDPQPKQPSYWGNRRIALAYRFFASYIQEQLDQLPNNEARVELLFDTLERTTNAILVKLEVKDHASAFTLFESLNNRGMELSPLDLIKNSMLARADRKGSEAVEDAYNRWQGILEDLGPNASEQERFLRYYYNMFDPVGRAGRRTPVATRSNLIRLYEEFLDSEGVDTFLDQLTLAAHQYGRIIDTVDDDEGGRLDTATTRLQRAQGAPGNGLLMYLLVKSDELDLSEENIAVLADDLTSFFVRRNVTSTPTGNEVLSKFIELARTLSGSKGKDALNLVRRTLATLSSSDDLFEAALRGSAYTDNTDMTRFILTSLAEQGQTLETKVDLWRQVGEGTTRRYVWTIEHIFPQGEHIPESWVRMLGGEEAAKAALEEHVHRLGNLTLTGYNSTLSNKSFEEKRDRVDQAGNFVGYKNGLNLNTTLRDAATWGVPQIEARADELVAKTLVLFPRPMA